MFESTTWTGKWWKWAGMLLLVVGGVWGVFGWQGQQAQGSHQRTADLAGLYQELRSDPATRGGNWLRTLHQTTEDVQGDVLWNNVRQAGVMRILNLPAPRKGHRYHVWIHDSRRPVGEPVSAAILETGSGKQELLVGLMAAEPVVEPYKFVLTLEPSDGDQAEALILLMAQP